MKILVTGATGFIGRHLVRRLAEEGAKVAILVRDVNYDPQLLPAFFDDSRQNLELFYGDLRNYNLTARAIRDAAPDRIVHLAAAGVTDPFLQPESALRHNVNGTLNLLRASFDSRGSGPSSQKVIVGRTPGEHKAMNVYAASKAAAWSFCQMYAWRYGWPIIGAMIFQAYGPYQPAHTFVQAALRSALAGADFAMTSGKQTRDWIYIGDVVAGLLAATATNLLPGASVDLGTGVPTSLLDVANIVYALVGRGGAPNVGAIPDRAGEEISQVADVSRSAKLLNWQPQIELADGLRLVLNSLTP